MRDSTNSTLVLGVRQFRLENSKEINVFVHCISRPIIEKSTAVVFAPFPLVLETAQVRKEFEDAKLAGMQNMYDRVDDFNWLRRQASPNWSINDTPPTEAAWALLDGDRTDTHREQALATLLSKQ
ncbi:hypothetical protein GGI07_005786 [Coemansia sp. Benny D115]|nr:hypothetical protein GGI07_005786 [Coemansia sp. Benny D115]